MLGVHRSMKIAAEAQLDSLLLVFQILSTGDIFSFGCIIDARLGNLTNILCYRCQAEILSDSIYSRWLIGRSLMNT